VDVVNTYTHLTGLYPLDNIIMLDALIHIMLSRASLCHFTYYRDAVWSKGWHTFTRQDRFLTPQV